MISDTTIQPQVSIEKPLITTLPPYLSADSGVGMGELYV